MSLPSSEPLPCPHSLTSRFPVSEHQPSLDISGQHPILCLLSLCSSGLLPGMERPIARTSLVQDFPEDSPGPDPQAAATQAL